MAINQDTVQAIVALAKTGTSLALQAVDALRQLRADGIDVPGIEQLEADIQRLQALPDLVQDGEE
ncbi:MAG: hypothetical protein ACNI3A_18665 [Desulfovibrio sp.]|uniref:hypothetical protein n=1 Tax=Desulfovibrio sp. 7SRBS1 TaxID=3378064 RepID=UPI003B41E779